MIVVTDIKWSFCKDFMEDDFCYLTKAGSLERLTLVFILMSTHAALSLVMDFCYTQTEKPSQRIEKFFVGCLDFEFEHMGKTFFHRESSPRTVRDGSESPSGGLHSSGLSFTSGLSSNGLNFTGLNSAGLHLSGPTQDSTTRGVKLVSISPLASPNSTRRAEKMDGTPAGLILRSCFKSRSPNSLWAMLSEHLPRM